MTLNVNSLLCRQWWGLCYGLAEARITRFRCNVALYLNCLHIKFVDEIARESLLISSIISDQPASKVKLTSKLGFICSKMSQLLRLVFWFASHRYLIQTSDHNDNYWVYRSNVRFFFALWRAFANRLYTKFEVASFSPCVNSDGEPPNFGELP